MKRLITLCAVLSLGFAGSVWACDGKHEDGKKEKTTQSQADEKNDKSATAPVKNAQGTEQASAGTK